MRIAGPFLLFYRAGPQPEDVPLIVALKLRRQLSSWPADKSEWGLRARNYSRKSGRDMSANSWPLGPMDKARVYGTRDCRFESYSGHFLFVDVLD